MHVSVEGALSIEKRTGKYGTFSVGRLNCFLGSFALKDPTLDQFKEGVYRGHFDIAKIESEIIALNNGRVMVQTRAVLASMRLQVLEAEQASGVALEEPDPIELPPPFDSPSPAKPKAVAKDSRKAVQTPPPQTANPPAEIVHRADSPSLDHASDEDSALKSLFGELWPLGDRVQLDPVSMRSDQEGHRQRCAWLNQHGYTFDFLNQVFTKSP